MTSHESSAGSGFPAVAASSFPAVDGLPPASSSWGALLTALLRGTDLTTADAIWAMGEVVGGRATSAQIAGFLIALRAKGITAAEIAGLAGALREHATPVPIPGPTVDIAGTGGDGTGAVNISTMAAVVAASAGATVVKHGGRASSSSTAGSADLLERLGVPLVVTALQAARLAAEVGITFLFAPNFSPGLRHATDARRQLGVPTVFNLLGPLINPAHPRHQVIGVAAARMAPLVADALAARAGSALVVRGDDGLDNLTTTTTSRIWVVRDGVVTASTLDPADLGLPRVEPAALRGGDANKNAGIAHAVLKGRRGPVRDVVLLNAAAVLVVAAASEESLVDQLRRAMARCAEAVDSGAAKATLERWVNAGRDLIPGPSDGSPARNSDPGRGAGPVGDRRLVVQHPGQEQIGQPPDE